MAYLLSLCWNIWRSLGAPLWEGVGFRGGLSGNLRVFVCAVAVFPMAAVAQTVTLVGPSVLIDEGAAAEFTVSLSDAVAGELSVSWSAMVDGNAEPEDFSPASGVVVFPANSVESQSFSVRITDDEISELSEVFSVRLGTATGGTVSVNTDPASVSIAESDPIVVSIRGPDSITEGAPEVFYVLSLNKIPSEDLLVSHTVRHASGASLSQNTWTFGAGISTQWNIGLVIDEPLGSPPAYRPADTLTLALSILSGGGGPTPSLERDSIEIQIIDNDYAVEITVFPSAPVAEGDALTFGVTLLGESPLTVPVPVVIEAGTADAADYSGDDSVTFAGGGASFTVDIGDDSLSEPAETFTVRLGPVTGLPDGVFVIDRTRYPLTVTIAESDPVTISVSAAESSVEEGGDVEYTVEISGEILLEDLNVRFATSQTGDTVGHAKTGADYTPVDTTLVFSPGGVTSQTVTVNALYDDISGEGREELAVLISASGGGATPLLNPDRLSLFINERPAYTVTLPAASASTRESGATGGVLLFLQVTGSREPLGNFTISYNLVAGTATEGEDYVAVGSRTLNFDASGFDMGRGVYSAMGVFNIDVVDDAEYEPEESFSVEIGAFSGVFGDTLVTGTGPGQFSATVLTIKDNDYGMAISGFPGAPVTEGESADFGVTLMGPAVLAVRATWSTSPGITVPASGSLVFVADRFSSRAERFSPFAVEVPDNAVVELGQSFTTRLSALTVDLDGSGQVIGIEDITKYPIDVQIIDNDYAVEITVFPLTPVAEGDALTFEVTLLSDSPLTVPVPVVIEAGTADAADYSGDDSVTFTGGGASFAVDIGDDSLSEPVETFTVRLGPVTSLPDGVFVIDRTSYPLTVTIAESDPVTVSVSATESSVEEGGEVEYTVEIQDASLSEDLNVQFATSQTGDTVGHASTGTDYTHVDTTLVFSPGGVTSQTVTVNALYDDISGEGSEELAVSISASGGEPTPVLNPDRLSLFIDERPAYIVALLSPSESTRESGATGGKILPLQVTGSRRPLGDFTISYNLVADTATEGEDYAATGAQTLNFDTSGFSGGVYSAEGVIDIGVVDDMEYEPEETFRVEIGTFSGVFGDTFVTGTGTGQFSATVLTIEDNDYGIAISDFPAVLVTEGETADFKVTLMGPAVLVVRATWSTSPGITEPASDSLEFAADPSNSRAERFLPFAVEVLDNAAVELGQSFTTRLSALTVDLGGLEEMIGVEDITKYPIEVQIADNSLDLNQDDVIDKKDAKLWLYAQTGVIPVCGNSCGGYYRVLTPLVPDAATNSERDAFIGAAHAIEYDLNEDSVHDSRDAAIFYNIRALPGSMRHPGLRSAILSGFWSDSSAADTPDSIVRAVCDVYDFANRVICSAGSAEERNRCLLILRFANFGGRNPCP